MNLNFKRCVSGIVVSFDKPFQLLYIDHHVFGLEQTIQLIVPYHFIPYFTLVLHKSLCRSDYFLHQNHGYGREGTPFEFVGLSHLECSYG